MLRVRIWLCAMVLTAANAFQIAGAQSVRVVHRSAGDTLAKTYRLFMPRGKPTGLLVLLADWGSTYADYDQQAMRLPEMLQDRGLAVVQINNTPWQTNYFADSALDVIDAMIAEVVKETQAPAGRIVIGGIQMGGMAALKYAARCVDKGCAAGSARVGAFAVNPTLDLERFARANHVYLKRPGGRMFSRAPELASLERELGGRLDAIPDVYRRNSVYLHNEPEGGLARFLRNTPVRLYLEADVQFYLKADIDPMSSNLVDILGLSLFLRRIGNTRAELMATTGRAILPSGRPNPGAWAIVDEPDLVNWIVRITGTG